MLFQTLKYLGTNYIINNSEDLRRKLVSHYGILEHYGRRMTPSVAEQPLKVQRAKEITCKGLGKG